MQRFALLSGSDDLFRYGVGASHLVHGDIAAVLLAAPYGFIEDGSNYYLFTAKPFPSGSVQDDLHKWLRTVAD
ncbi:hypothetical protein [Candidatus Pantoea formicae]|uniref:Uncharacterized protein n=1 Tax=Candidatus Pantoea formicae TaxID=2608355 RepID=A0ABX0QZY5_9GAMM|nr:hypothetical protein [Pantoea formicae]MDF7650029.1 hypothetical protein [Erwiniaceae bacterium L1_54_3]NIF02537.1 hypothetical protein [Pantoea formicae]